MQNASLLRAKIKTFFHNGNKKPPIRYSQQKNIVPNLKKEEKKQGRALRFLKTRLPKPCKGQKTRLTRPRKSLFRFPAGLPVAGPEATLPGIRPLGGRKKESGL